MDENLIPHFTFSIPHSPLESVFFSGVELPVFLLDEFLVYMRVDLRGADVGVAQQFLQNAQVHARLQAVGSKTVPEGMR